MTTTRLRSTVRSSSRGACGLGGDSAARRRFRRIGRVGVLLVGAALIVPLAAQDDGTGRSTGESGLGVRQQRVERMFNELEQRFIVLATKLNETEPERAQRLIETLQQAKEMLIQQRMNEIASLINRTDLANATDEQAKLLADLRLLIRMLIDESLDDEKLRQEEIQRLERWKEEIKNILGEELPQERESAKLADRDKTIEELEARIRAVQELIRKQQEAKQQAQEAADRGLQALDQAANRQHEVRSETEALERSMTPAEIGGENQPGENQPGENQPGENQPGENQPGQNQ
ncbi:MAG TPA: hypothetical protein DCQ98_22880, partial [Planctomycetaceae bacterium]|nr:hypothetical protein [Planctomycetaceae bacterium]